MMSSFCKNNRALVCMVVVLSFFLSLLFQLVFSQVDAQQFSVSGTDVTNDLEFIGYTVLQDESYALDSDDAQIVFPAPDMPISTVGIVFTRPVSEQTYVEVFYTTGDLMFGKDRSVSQYIQVADTSALFSIPSGEYSSIRIDLENEVGDSYVLQEVFVSSEPVSFLQKNLSKISLLHTVFFAMLFGALSLLFLQRYQITHIKKINRGLQFFKSLYFPLSILAVISLLYGFIVPLLGDDMTSFWQVFQENSKRPFQLLEYVHSWYASWSSRFIINYVLLFISQSKLLWNFLNTAVSLLCIYSIIKIARIKEQKHVFLVVGLFLVYPMWHMGTAGWMATTLNYLWTLSFGLYALLPLVRNAYEESIRKWEYPLFVAALLYAANQEQMASILLGFYGTWIVYGFVKKKRPIKFLYVQFGLIVMSFVLHLAAPGNASRRASEIASFFPQFDSFSLTRKLEMGFSSAMYELLMQPNVLFALFALILFCCVLKNKKHPLSLIPAGIVLCSSLVFGLFASVFTPVFPFIPSLTGALTETGTMPTFSNLSSLFPFSFLLLIVLCILFSLYVSFENKQKSYAVMLMFLAGIASRTMLGVSPTIWASDGRTYIFLYFAVLLCAVFLYPQLSKKSQTYVGTAVAIGATLSTIDYIYFVHIYYY